MNKRKFDRQCTLLLDDVYRFLFHLCGHQQTAEDLTQETFLRARRYRSSLRSDALPKSWLLKIGHNLYRDWLKKSRLVIPLDAESTREYVSDSTPVEDIFQRIQNQEVRSLLQSLPEDFREVIILQDVHELGYQEIADILDCPIGTVMSRLHRGRNLLERKLRGVLRSTDRQETEGDNLIHFRRRKG